MINQWSLLHINEFITHYYKIIYEKGKVCMKLLFLVIEKSTEYVCRKSLKKNFLDTILIKVLGNIYISFIEDFNNNDFEDRSNQNE